MYIFSENLQVPSYYFKEQSPKKKFKIKKCIYFFVGGGLPKWANWFLTRSKETKNLIFTSFLASNKSNKPRGAGLKNVCKQNVCADFRVQ